MAEEPPREEQDNNTTNTDMTQQSCSENTPETIIEKAKAVASIQPKTTLV